MGRPVVCDPNVSPRPRENSRHVFPVLPKGPSQGHAGISKTRSGKAGERTSVPRFRKQN